MAYTARDIMHENGRFWVLHDRNLKGCYRVMRNEATHSVERATFHFSSRPDYALARAIEDCDRRASGLAGAKA